jgi:hypothetical protein
MMSPAPKGRVTTLWYTLLGYGIIRDWAYEIIETLASVNTPPPYSF